MHEETVCQGEMIMKRQFIHMLSGILLLFGLLIYEGNVSAGTHGIYITAPTLETTSLIKPIIVGAKASGIDTFVIDYTRDGKLYRQNLALVKAAGFRYVARIVMFPDGALPSQIRSQAYIEKRIQQVKAAIALGAQEIQLDYIRYRPTQAASAQNAKDIAHVIAQVKPIVSAAGIPLQVDIFGIAAYTGNSPWIGQKPAEFAPLVTALCPMVYPSHFEPFRYHAVRPYTTVYTSLTKLREHIKAYPRVKIYAYLELFNYRYPLPR